ncbi:uncharacterized protein LOC125660309 isoform X2 [Ostrea edulis]|uniref:uncharacterized protein LOC125660309 isoform X2 n=1 Tax=Ostrea edulis TaxID=37623 RepID=UPI0024AE975B|nr:uncharacterized protein LOC125660309 isoform X2 [Ostrea edulis]
MTMELCVAQVRRIEMNPEKGCAEVTLFDKNSTLFVIEKIWRINGTELQVKDLSGFKGKELDWKSDMVHVENNGQIENVKINCHLPYQSYRKKASSFWMDIPHHEAKIRKKRPKDKFPMSKLRWKNMNSILKVQQVKDNRKKKKRKKPNVVSNHDFDKYSSLTLDEFNIFLKKVEAEVQMCVQGKTTAVEIGRNIEDSKGNCSKELKNPETAQCLCEDQQKHIHYHEIPLCLWYRQKMTVMEIDSKQNSLFNLKEKIRTEFGIPAKLKLLMYKGKDMQRTASSINFQPYDNIFVSIKGRGGMQEPLTGVTTGSSERDVEQWL